MTSHYIVSGPGRVGGHLVLGAILSAGVRATRTHDPNFSFGCDQDTALILVDRRDRFAAVMSNCIVWHTGQSTSYVNDRIEPFEVDTEQFLYLCQQHFDYYGRHDYSRPFAQVRLLYYCDFCSNIDFIYDALDLAKRIDALSNQDEIDRLMHSPAPYNFRQLVTNWQDLHRKFVQFSLFYQPS